MDRMSTADSVQFDHSKYLRRVIDIKEEQEKAKIRELNERLEKLRND